MPSKWLLSSAPVVPPDLARVVAGYHPALGQLLVLRGLSDPDNALGFLDPDCYTPVDPGTLPGASEVAACVEKVLSSGGHVRIWGDFDADGQTSTSVLLHALRFLDMGRVTWALPGRGDGHGLCERAIRQAVTDKVDLLLTCDTGISDADAVSLANGLGVKVAITDHHDPPEVLPAAAAIADPKFLPTAHPLHELAGVGVAYVVAQILLRDRPGGPAHLEELLDLVALGLVADVATQVRDVRYLIQRGIAVMRRTHRQGLLALADIVGIDIKHVDEQTLAYQFGPRLNAAGRLADPELAMRLLLAGNASVARDAALELEALNQDRRARTDSVMHQAREMMRRDPSLSQQPAIILIDSNWESGVTGLVAGRLADDEGKPVLLVTRHADGSCVASGRSVQGIDIHGAIVSQAHLMERQGGHPMAAGFTVREEHLDEVISGMLSWVGSHSAAPSAPTLDIELTIPWAEAGLDLARSLNQLRPFGDGNRPPILLLEDGVFVRAEDISHRRETNHRRLTLVGGDGKQHKVLWFNAKELPAEGDRIDLACQLRTSLYRGKEQLTLRLVEWRPAENALSPEHQTVIDGIEIVDLRSHSGSGDLASQIDRIKGMFGDGLALWGEGTGRPPGSRSRVELESPPYTALAIATAPPGASTLHDVIDRSEARRVILLPMRPAPTLSRLDFVKHIAAMAKTVLASTSHSADILRMAAHLGVTSAAVLLGLQALEARGMITLTRGNDGLLLAAGANRPGSATTDRRQGQIHAALSSELREMAAYQTAFLMMPVEILFAT